MPIFQWPAIKVSLETSWMEKAGDSHTHQANCKKPMATEQNGYRGCCRLGLLNISEYSFGAIFLSCWWGGIWTFVLLMCS